MDTAITDQLLDGDTVVVDRAAWERLHPTITPADNGATRIFSIDSEWCGMDRVAALDDAVWTGHTWETVDAAEKRALEILAAVAWCRSAL